MQRNQVTAGMDLVDDDPVAQAAGGIQTSSSSMLSSTGSGMTSSGGPMRSIVPTSRLGVDYAVTAGGFGVQAASTAESDAIMKEITKREVKIRNRLEIGNLLIAFFFKS